MCFPSDEMNKCPMLSFFWAIRSDVESIKMRQDVADMYQNVTFIPESSVDINGDGSQLGYFGYAKSYYDQQTIMHSPILDLSFTFLDPNN